jgi:hypothetical protein
MSIELTEEPQRAIAAQREEPPRVINPRTQEAFVLLRAEVYERLRALLDGEFDPREAYPFIDRAMAEDDANDPCLEKYQHLRREDA